MLSQSRHVSVPYGSFDNVLLTKETSCIEASGEHRYYASGVGLVQVVAVSSGSNGTEGLQLTTIN